MKQTQEWYEAMAKLITRRENIRRTIQRQEDKLALIEQEIGEMAQGADEVDASVEVPSELGPEA